MSQSPARYVWIDVAKGMAIVLVVLHHSENFLKHRGFAAGWWLGLDQSLQAVRMPLFFLASGMVAGSAVARSWKGLIQRRVLLLVWLVVAWSVVYFLLSQLDPWIGSARGDQTTPGELLFELVRPITEIWYLQALAVFLLLARLTRRVPTVPLLASATVLSVAVGSWLVELGNFAWESMGSTLVFFLAGLRFRDHIAAAMARVRGRHAVVAAAAFVTATTAVAVTHTWAHPVTTLPLQLLAVAAGASTAAVLGRRWLGRLLSGVGRTTLPVYLTHVPVIGLVTIGTAAAFSTLPGPVTAVAPVLLTALVLPFCLAVVAPLLRRVPGAVTLPGPLGRWAADAGRPTVQRRGAATPVADSTAPV